MALIHLLLHSARDSHGDKGSISVERNDKIQAVD